jgi:osmotically-inducible protein OsmY
MAYGNAQRLGETINPALMQADYSGFANAGAILGNTLANTGQQIGDAIKTSKENERKLKKAEKVAKSIQDLAIPGLSEMGESALSELANPDLTTNQKLAIAESINDSLNIGMIGLQEKRAQEEFNMRRAAAGAAAGARNAEAANKILEAQNLLKGFPSELAILEASGYPEQARVFKEQYDLAINNGDFETATSIAGRVAGFTGAMKPATLQPVEPTASAQEISNSVRNALLIGEANAVDLPDNIVNLFGEAINSGDTKAASKIAGDISQSVDSLIKIQREETKNQVRLQDGTEILVGSKTGTRYTPTGQPIPKNSPVYTQPIAERETTIEQKEKEFAKVSERWKSGDVDGALNLYNALASTGFFGRIATKEELEIMMSGKPGSNPLDDIRQNLFPE